MSLMVYFGSKDLAGSGIDPVIADTKLERNNAANNAVVRLESVNHGIAAKYIYLKLLKVKIYYSTAPYDWLIDIMQICRDTFLSRKLRADFPSPLIWAGVMM